MNIKNNKFSHFSLGTDMINWLEQYPSHSNETSFAKGIPNTEVNQSIIDRIAKFVPLRRRYRGNSKPGYRRPRDFVHKEFADTIALYEK